MWQRVRVPAADDAGDADGATDDAGDADEAADDNGSADGAVSGDMYRASTELAWVEAALLEQVAEVHVHGDLQVQPLQHVCLQIHKVRVGMRRVQEIPEAERALPLFWPWQLHAELHCM